MRLDRITLVATVAMASLLLHVPENVADTPARPEQTDLGTERTVLDFDPDGQSPLITARINGKGPFTFIFDTGAMGFIVHQDLAKELNLPVIGESHMGDPSNPEAIRVDQVRMESVTVGSIVLTGVTADSWAQPFSYGHHAGGAHIRGILGLSMFADCLVTFDYEHGHLIFEKGELPPIDDKEIIAWNAGDDELPTLKLTVGDVTLDAHIDSGSPGKIMLPDKMRKKLAFKREPVVVAHARTVNSEFVIREGTFDGQVKFGSNVFNEPKLSFVTVLDSIGFANIGSSVLRKFVVSFDQKNGRVRFAPTRG